MPGKGPGGQVQPTSGVSTRAMKLVVLEGDQTGQELLEQALRVLDPTLLGLAIELERFDLSLESRRATSNRVVLEGAEAMKKAGLGLKAATITPEGADDVGSPNRIIREEIDGKVIVRTGRRLPGVNPIAGLHHPISIVRMAVGDAYGARQWREGEAGSPDEVALRTERITRAACRAVAEYAFRAADEMGARVYGGPKWTVSPVYEGMLKEELDAAADRHTGVPYEPVLIDATYAGLVSGAIEMPLVIPALNRDGDCLSDLVLPMFGSIAAAESVLLAFDDDYRTTVAMAEAPHGTAPALQGRDLANPLAMILACAAVLRHAAVRYGSAVEASSKAIYRAALSTVAAGVKTPDLGGHAGTTEFTDSVIERIGDELERLQSHSSA
jgi:isocitrate dehydrogenase (NAD+)